MTTRAAAWLGSRWAPAVAGLLVALLVFITWGVAPRAWPVMHDEWAYWTPVPRNMAQIVGGKHSESGIHLLQDRALNALSRLTFGRRANVTAFVVAVVSAYAMWLGSQIKIGNPVDRNDWGMSPPTVNAYYNAVQNEIAFPAGILQPPMFDMDADDASNYGGIGAVIGHEMGHGFDDQGSKFDFAGNLKNWWTDGDRKKFESRAQCIIDQFNTIDVGDGLRHNGRLVVGEALGDLGGLALAYRAYKRTLNGQPGPVIDGYTADQRFFISFARSWSSHARPESVRMRLQVDPHPLARWRANATLMNMPEFHQAFACKRGDAMVRDPDKQCKLW